MKILSLKTEVVMPLNFQEIYETEQIVGGTGTPAVDWALKAAEFVQRQANATPRIPGAIENNVRNVQNAANAAKEHANNAGNNFAEKYRNEQQLKYNQGKYYHGAPK